MMSFQERAKLGLELLSKQSPITLTKARSQAQKLKTQSTTNKKKQRDQNCLSQKNNLCVAILILVNMCQVTNDVIQGVTEVLAYGAAVYVEKI